MTNIGIIGAGIAGLHLSLLMQRHGVPVTLYADRSPEQLRRSRLPNTVARFASTRAREAELGVAHWEAPELGSLHAAHLRITGTPVEFCGTLSEPASFVDMRLYEATLLEDFAARGGRIMFGALEPGDLSRLSLSHDLVVVASGRGRLADVFPRIPERSPYSQPQRRLFAGLFHGISRLEPNTLAFTIAPGHGEIFNAPFLTFDGLVHNLLIEGIPGGGFQALMDQRYEDDPKGFETTVLDVLRAHAPSVYERIDTQAFRLTRPLDQHKGAITPMVRRGYVALETGRLAIAIGDAHIQNDPVLGQGANAASHAAWTLGQAILDGAPFDEAFCRRVEDRIWEYTGAVTDWTNATLEPPTPHAEAVFAAATQDPAIGSAVINSLSQPQRGWAIFGSPQGAASLLSQFGRELPAAHAQVA
jgi:2-polyprenyl-6-methoxyphenol hydroxylase-like FAD-dependent oxidoreductase